MALENRQYDARGNEFVGALDAITGQTVTDARTISVALGALNAETVVDMNGQKSVNVHLFTGSNATMTVVFEGTVDGTNYFTLPSFDTAATAMVASVALSAATINKVYYITVTGYRRMRVRCSVFTSGSITVAMRASQAPLPPVAEVLYPTTLWVTATAAANTQATATLPAAPGLFHYITHIDMTRNATAALAGTATLIHTSTNLPGSPAWSVGNAMVAGGTQLDVVAEFSCPLKSSVVNTNTTLVMPAAGAAVLNRINVGYYLGP